MTFTESNYRFNQSDETFIGMFQADPLTPYDYLRTSRRTVHLEPEKHLMHAILEEAIKTFRLHASTRSARERRLFQEAQAWIMTRNDDSLFSFENICEVLGLDHDCVRSGLARWKEQQSGFAMAQQAPRSRRQDRRRNA